MDVSTSCWCVRGVVAPCARLALSALFPWHHIVRRLTALLAVGDPCPDLLERVVLVEAGESAHGLAHARVAAAAQAGLEGEGERRKPSGRPLASRDEADDREKPERKKEAQPKRGKAAARGRRRRRSEAVV